jgi:hypothetical protein
MVQLNLVIQGLLFLAVIYAAYLARKKQMGRHCLVMRITGGVLVATTLALMLPLMLDYTGNGIPNSFTGYEIIIHHSIGVLVILIWIFVNLAQAGVIKWPWRMLAPMRIASVLWVLTVAMGTHLYFVIWG